MWKLPGPEVRVRASTYGVIVLVSLVVVAVLFGDPQRKVADLFKDWQSLIAGGLAIVAAYISLRGPREQIRQAEAHAREAALREEYAARGLLSVALDRITQYAWVCSDRSADLFERTKYASNLVELPSFDRSDLLLVRDAIRYAPPVYRDRMLALLSALQIMDANALSTVPTVPEHHLFERCAEVEYLCETLFDYGRGRDDSFSIDAPLRIPPDRLRQQAFFSERGPDFWPHLDDAIKIREKFEPQSGDDASGA